MKFEKYLTDGIIKGRNIKDYMNMMEDAISNIKKYSLFNSSVVWRGFSHKSASIVYKVTNDRSGSYFGKPAAINVIKGLDLKTEPIFATITYNQAKFFGNPHIFVPCDNFISYYNENFEDVMHIDDKSDVGEIISGYKKYTNKIPSSGDWNEIILSCKSYYLVNQSQIIWNLQKSRYATIKKPEDFVKYKDVVKLYNEYILYWKWWYKQKGRNFEED